jgi:HAE1 family hydrophobic/amphiphilic exporter-1
MNITQIAIRRGVTFIMIYLIAIGFGLFSLARLNLDLYPKLEFPMIAIITQYTGVSPYDIETVVTRPMEEAVASAKNVKKVSSTSSQGLSIISLEFEWGTDMDQAKIDVRDNLDFVRDALPDDIIEPLIVAFDFSAQPVLYLSVASVLHGQAELRRISEREIEPRIERIPGVAAVFTMGGMRREIKVQADPARLRATQISIQQVSTALQMNNMQVPSGWIENAEQEFTLQTLGEYTSIEEIENTPVAVINGSVIRVKDVATVVDGFAEQRQEFSNGCRKLKRRCPAECASKTFTMPRPLSIVPCLTWEIPPYKPSDWYSWYCCFSCEIFVVPSLWRFPSRCQWSSRSQ